MAKPRLIGAIVSRSTLRDVMNRLRKIKQATGKGDEEGGENQGTGDPFRDKIIAFQKQAKQVGEQIAERNSEAQKGQLPASEIARSSHDINVELRNLTAEHKAIEALAEAAVRDLARTNKKIAKAGKTSDERAEKQALRERIVKERQQAVATCKQVLESLKELNQQRNMTAKEAKAAAQNAAAGKPVQATRLNETLTERMNRDKRRRQRMQKGGDADEEMDAPATRRLSEDPETARYHQELVSKQREQDRILDIIQSSVVRIGDIALQIGHELEQQAHMLEDVEDKVDKANKDLKGINRMLNKTLKQQKPMNMIIRVMAFLLVLGLVGFFLDQFGVI